MDLAHPEISVAPPPLCQTPSWFYPKRRGGGKERKGTSLAGRTKSGRKVWNRAADWLRPALFLVDFAGHRCSL